MSHELRWNPLLREWIIVSGKRDERPWRREHCPFCAGELETQGSWDVLALRNKFPALSPDAPALSGKNPYYRPSALGYCEVILETSEHEGDFHTIPLGQVSRYLRLLVDRTLALGSEHSVKYVMPFKNRSISSD